MKKVVIIGNGNMAFAIAQGLVNSYKLEIVGRNLENLEEFKQRLTSTKNVTVSSIKNFSIKGETVILSTKPNNLDDVSKKVTGEAEVIYSVLAGTSIKSLRDKLDSRNYVRTMPNLSALYQASMTTLTGDIEYRDRAIELFSYIGEALWLETENELDIATAIAGSGPAYLSLIAEALADGGVYAGLKRTESEKVVQGLFAGFPSLLNSAKPSLIKDGVMSPKGTTAYGYKALEDGQVRSSMMSAIEKAYRRAVELRG